MLVVSMEDMLRRTMGEHIQLEVDLQADAWLAYTDGHQLENALLNLVINARDAMPNGGRLGVHTENQRIEQHQPDAPEPGDYVVLCVTDNGAGMSAQTIAKAFDPFFTTKPIGQGTGLGLSMVYGFAKQTGGHVRIDSALGEHPGHAVSATQSERRPGPAGPAQATDMPGARSGEIVLVVEDEAAVRMLVVEVLQELGYQVLEACDATSALPYLHGDQRLDLLVSDFGLPGLNGRQLVESARQHRPELKVLFITGYVPDEEMRNDFIGPGMDILAAVQHRHPRGAHPQPHRHGRLSGNRNSAQRLALSTEDDSKEVSAHAQDIYRRIRPGPGAARQCRGRWPGT